MPQASHPARAQAQDPSDASPLLADYLEGWLAGIRCRPTTMADYRQSVRVYVTPRIGHLALAALRADDLDALYRTLEREGRRRGVCTTAGHTCSVNACAPERHGGLAPKTVRNVHGMLHRALAQACERGHVRTNVAALANPPSARDARDAAVRHDIWDAATLGRFLSRVRGDALHAPLRLIATTGARRGEVLGLRWREVDLVGARVLLGAQTLTAVSGRLVWQRHGKTAAATRDVALDAVTLDVLTEHRARQASLAAGAGSRWHEDEHGPLVFTTATLCVRVAAQAAEAEVAHLRTRDSTREVDLVVTGADGRLVAIEVELGARVDDHEVRHLTWLATELGDRVADRIVLTAGPHAYRRSDGVAVVPLALLGP